MSFVPENLDKTAFGELSTAEPTPVAQIMAPYGILEKAESFELNGGIASANNSLYEISSGTNSAGFCALLTRRQITYRPGQGLLGRFTAVFDAPQLNNVQQAGLINNTDRVVFGFNESQQFGITRYYFGESEIQELTITTPAGGAENATVTVDGTGYTVPLTAGTVQHNAYEIANSLNIQVPDYSFSSNNDQVVARSLLAEAAGLFAFTSATAAASWAQVQAGAEPFTEFAAQSSWSEGAPDGFDPLDGNGNVYKIRMQFLGYGMIYCFIEDNETGDLELVHKFKYAGRNPLPSVGNPTFRVGWLSQNYGNTVDVTVKGASAAGFIEGKSIRTEAPRAFSNTNSSVGTANFINILTIRNRLVLNTRRNRAEVFGLNLSPSTDSSKGVIVNVLSGATISGDVNFQYIDKDNSVIEYATDGGVVTNGRLILSFTIPAAGGDPINLEELSALILPGETITVAARVISGAASAVTASLVWQEDL